MSFPNYKYGTGLGNVGSYQASGKPYVSGAIDAMQGGAVKITFPAVTRWIYVINHEDSGVRVGFSERGVLNDGNYFKLAHLQQMVAHKHPYVLSLKSQSFIYQVQKM